MEGFITMIRDVSNVAYDASAATIINANAIASMGDKTWGETTIGTIKLLEPSANDISGILLMNTIILGTDLSGLVIGDGNEAETSYSIALGQGAVASGTEKFVYRDVCNNRFVFNTAAGGEFLINGSAPSGGGGGTTVPGDLLVHGTMETSGVILAPIHSAEGSSQSAITELDPSKNPLMTKGMYWINEAQDVSGWNYTTAMDISRSFGGMASLGGKLYAVGGLVDAGGGGGQVRTNSAQVYDPIIDSWTPIASIASAKNALGLAALGGKLYAVTGTNNVTISTTCEVYDPSANSWGYIAPTTFPRELGAAATLRGKLYIVGGGDGSPTTYNSGEVYDPINNGSWNPIAPMNARRRGFGLAALGGKLYAVGGFSSSPSTFLNSAEVYDPIDNSWNYIASMSTTRYGLGLTALGGKLYAGGGVDAGGAGGSFLDSVEVYDPTNPSGGWQAVSSMAIARQGLGYVALGGELYAAGGQQSGATPNSSVEVYDPSLVQMPQITHQGEDFYVSHQRGGPKTFVIPHPEYEGKMLRHACLEAPTRGTNVYEYQITTTEDNQTTEIDLPSYFKHINGQPKVYVYSGAGSQWGSSRGYMNDEHTKAIIETEKPGMYNVMVTGVRKDPAAVAYSATENIDDPIAPKDI